MVANRCIFWIRGHSTLTLANVPEPDKERLIVDLEKPP